jgi:hypothetical protein
MDPGMTDLPSLITAAQQCAQLFRLGRDIEAALEMVELFERAMPLLAERPAAEREYGTQLLERMLECQQRQDWLALADYMEYEWVECLRG